MNSDNSQPNQERANEDPFNPATDPGQSRVYLFRHGETNWSLSGQYTGQTDLPLTANGERAARQLGERLQGIVFTQVFTSPRRRAQRTCELVGLRRTPKICDDLAEWNYGDLEGQHSCAVHEKAPHWSLFRDGCPGGESPAQVAERADRLIARLRTLEGNIALFCHGHIGRVLAARWIGLPVLAAQHLLLGTASVSILAYEHERLDSPAIALWNWSVTAVMPEPISELTTPARTVFA